MLRVITDTLLRGAARFRPRVRRLSGITKVNLGGGIEAAPGWINVDGSIHAFVAGAPRFILAFLYRRTGSVRHLISETEYVRRFSAHEFVFCDFSYGLPFEEETVDFIFCSHVLEHFFRDDASRLLDEMFRILKPGGRARICVPDLARAMQLYQDGAKREALQFFFTDERGRFDQHHYMYDYDLVADLLKERGFSDVQKCEFQEGELPDLHMLDNRPEITLFVEASKQA